MTLHLRYGHTPFGILRNAARQGLLPKAILTEETPKCPSCLYGTGHRRNWKTRGSTRTVYPKALKPGDVDQLGQALLALTQELWVVKDRQRILEALLEEKGIAVAALLENYQPNAELAQALSKDRAAFIERLLGSLEDN